MKPDRNVLNRLPVAFLTPAALLACSGITVVKDGKILVAANNDTPYSREMKLRVVTNHYDLFGRMCISMDVVPGWAVPMPK